MSGAEDFLMKLLAGASVFLAPLAIRSGRNPRTRARLAYNWEVRPWACARCGRPWTEDPECDRKNGLCGVCDLHLFVERLVD